MHRLITFRLERKSRSALDRLVGRGGDLDREEMTRDGRYAGIGPKNSIQFPSGSWVYTMFS